MKKFAFLFLILAAGLGLTVASFAEGEQTPEMGKGMKGDKKMGMGMHQQPVMLATTDGGVVVLMGGKLAKYDASLTLIKEVEMKGGPKPPMDDKMQAPQDEMPQDAPPPPAPDDVPAPAAQ